MTSEHEQYGRTFRDFLHENRKRIGVVILGVIGYFLASHLGASIPSFYLYLIIPASVLGLLLGVAIGYLREKPPLPPPVIILEPRGPTNARVFLTHDYTAIDLTRADAVPIGSTYGSTIWLASRVEKHGDKIIVEPSSLHVLAVHNPLEALAHVHSLDRLAEQLDDVMSKYIALYTETRAKARVLARRRVGELLNIERLAEKQALEELKKSIKGEGGEK